MHPTIQIARKFKPQCARKRKVFLHKSKQKEHIHVLMKKTQQKNKKKIKNKKRQLKYLGNQIMWMQWIYNGALTLTTPNDCMMILCILMIYRTLSIFFYLFAQKQRLFDCKKKVQKKQTLISVYESVHLKKPVRWNEKRFHS